MKNASKMNQRLLLAVAFQLVLVALVWWPRNLRTATEKKIFSNLTLGDLTSVTLEDGKAKAILSKVDGKWVVPEQFNYPVDEKKLSEFLGKMESISPGLTVGKTESTQRKLEVSDEKFTTKVIFQKTGEKDRGFYLGTSPQFRQVYLRVMGQDEIFASDKISPYDVPARSADWLDHALVGVKSEDIDSLEIQRGGELVTFLRVEEHDKDGKPSGTQWKIDGKAVDKSKFDGVLRNVSELRMQEVLGKDAKPEFGLQKPLARLKVHVKGTDGPRDLVVTIGSKMGEDYVVRVEGSPFIVKASGFQLTTLLTTKKKDFAS